MFAAMSATLAGSTLTTRAQNSDAATVSAAPPAHYTWDLIFSRDGRLIRDFQRVSPQLEAEHAVIITYDAKTRKILQTKDFGPNTVFLGATTDGAIALIGFDLSGEGTHPRIARVDLESGRSDQIPSDWLDAADDRPFASISSDGGLISTFANSCHPDRFECVTVYDWESRKPIAKQFEGHGAGGVDWGGVTPDGRTEFCNNRGGCEILEPGTGARVMSYGSMAIASADGKWVVEFPNSDFGDDPHSVPIVSGMTGRTLGHLEFKSDADDLDRWWRGAFCPATRKFIATGPGKVIAFNIPSGKKLKAFPLKSWRSADTEEAVPAVACSPDGERVAIMDRDRLTIHSLN
jgi:hypothetical protein